MFLTWINASLFQFFCKLSWHLPLQILSLVPWHIMDDVACWTMTGVKMCGNVAHNQSVVFLYMAFNGCNRLWLHYSKRPVGSNIHFPLLQRIRSLSHDKHGENPTPTSVYIIVLCFLCAPARAHKHAWLRGKVISYSGQWHSDDNGNPRAGALQMDESH